MCPYDETRLPVILGALDAAGVIQDISKLVAEYDACPERREMKWTCPETCPYVPDYEGPNRITFSSECGCAEKEEKRDRQYKLVETNGVPGPQTHIFKRDSDGKHLVVVEIIDGSPRFYEPDYLPVFEEPRHYFYSDKKRTPLQIKTGQGKPIWLSFGWEHAELQKMAYPTWTVDPPEAELREFLAEEGIEIETVDMSQF